jgi:phage N-6-adenine-methyltransferase
MASEEPITMKSEIEKERELLTFAKPEEWRPAMNTELMFSSATDLWETPQDLFDKLHSEFGFEIDVCATSENRKCPVFYSKEEDGLAQMWLGKCWMNPPYGKKIGKWVRKAFESAETGLATVVCLLPARTDTSWWHDYCMKGEVRFLRGRLKFGGHSNSAPFPSAVVVFRP